MAENLVIVESPAKAKTIEKILGKDYLVKSSFGHIRDLPSKGLGIDVENDFSPDYQISSDKLKVVSELKKLSSSAKTVWLASDEDREGEAIAWHLSQALNLDENRYKRIVFHEITSDAILKAIQTPRYINLSLVDAQQARRILDRLVGFELSPVLWRKVKPSLSAGRVQSVAVRLIVDREREIINFKAETYFKTSAIFTFDDENKNSYSFKAELQHKFKNESEAIAFLQNQIGATFSIDSVEKKPGKRTPAPPFTTSTLQQEASRKLGFSVSQTMTVAQRLYEAGHITYMRTDSVNLSNEAVNFISAVVKSDFGDEYLQRRKFKTKSKGAQEAHEAIRPTYVSKYTIDGQSSEKRLYELIWKRAVASQMSDAILEKTNINVKSSKSDKLFVAKGEVVVFDGFMKLYTESRQDDESASDEGILPPLSVGKILNVDSIDSVQRFQQRPARYSEASLVKQLEELGIGRPSTYAPTISTITSRGYVVKEDREGENRNYIALSLKQDKISTNQLTERFGSEKSKLFPTDIGMVVTDYLEANFPEIMDYNFTAKVEESFDEIALGEVEWKKMIKDFYKPFHSTVDKATAEKGYASAANRTLGVDKVSGHNVYARMGRFGPIVQIGDSEGDTKPMYASLKSGQLLETITLEQALELFKLPRTIGKYEDQDVIINTGRFGPYIRHAGVFTSLAKSDDPMSITLERAIELIEEKREKDRNKILRKFENDPKMEIVNGRWGPFITYDGGNYKLPKGVDYATMSYDEIKEIVDKAISEGGSKAKPARSSKTTKAKKTVKSKSKK